MVTSGVCVQSAPLWDGVALRALLEFPAVTAWVRRDRLRYTGSVAPPTVCVYGQAAYTTLGHYQPVANEGVCMPGALTLRLVNSAAYDSLHTRVDFRRPLREPCSTPRGGKRSCGELAGRYDGRTAKLMRGYSPRRLPGYSPRVWVGRNPTPRGAAKCTSAQADQRGSILMRDRPTVGSGTKTPRPEVRSLARMPDCMYSTAAVMESAGLHVL